MMEKKKATKTTLPAMNPIVFLPLFLLVIFIASKNKWKTLKNKKLLPLPPSPSKLPIIGNLHQLGPLLYRSLRKLSARHGPLMLLQLGRVPTLIVSSPETAKQILQTHDLSFATRPQVKASRVIFYGTKDLAFAPYGDYWRQVRKVCAIHLLSSRMVQSLKPMREEEVTLMLEKITQASMENGIVPLTEVLRSFASDLICRVVLGRSMKGDQERRKFLCEMIHATSVLFGSLYVEDFFPRLWWLDALLGLEGKLKKNFMKWDALLDEVLEDHVERSNRREMNGTDFAHVLLTLPDDYIGDSALKRDHTKAILMDMIIAGTETTSAVLDWSMAELIRSPEIMKKAQSEVKGKVKGTGRLVKEEELCNLEYLQAVIKETLRLLHYYCLESHCKTANYGAMRSQSKQE